MVGTPDGTGRVATRCDALKDACSPLHVQTYPSMRARSSMGSCFGTCWQVESTTQPYGISIQQELIAHAKSGDKK